MSEHTKGPWSDPVNYGASKFEIQGDHFRIATVDKLPDARRIVACVNACEGMDDPALNVAESRSRGQKDKS